MDLRQVFGQAVWQYEKYRPCYCPEMFSDIFDYAALPIAAEGMAALEIGIGTGQATPPFLGRGLQVAAVDISEEMIRYVKQKFSEQDHFSAVHTSFEAFSGEEASYDLIYSGTAFHWIPEKEGFLKASSLLKPGGTLALFWNRAFVGRDDDPVHRAIQAVYEKHRPLEAKPVEVEDIKYNQRLWAMTSYGFADVQFHLYHQTRVFTAHDYIGLLHTYSDHNAMEPAKRQELEQEVQKAIEDFGGTITVYDTIELYLGTKRKNSF